MTAFAIIVVALLILSKGGGHNLGGALIAGLFIWFLWRILKFIKDIFSNSDGISKTLDDLRKNKHYK